MIDWLIDSLTYVSTETFVESQWTNEWMNHYSSRRRDRRCGILVQYADCWLFYSFFDQFLASFNSIRFHSIDETVVQNKNCLTHARTSIDQSSSSSFDLCLFAFCRSAVGGWNICWNIYMLLMDAPSRSRIKIRINEAITLLFRSFQQSVSVLRLD